MPRSKSPDESSPLSAAPASPQSSETTDLPPGWPFRVQLGVHTNRFRTPSPPRTNPYHVASTSQLPLGIPPHSPNALGHVYSSPLSTPPSSSPPVHAPDLPPLEVPQFDDIDLGPDGRDGMDPHSSPIHGKTQEAKRQSILNKIAKYDTQKTIEKDTKKVKNAAAQQKKKEEEEEALTRVFVCMRENKVSIGQLLIYIFSAKFHDKHRRYLQFFNSPSRMRAVLKSWLEEGGQKSRETIIEWATETVSGEIQKEGESVSGQDFLRTKDKDVTSDFGLGFSLPRMFTHIRTFCPLTVCLLMDFATTPRQKREASGAFMAQKQNVRYSINLQIWIFIYTFYSSLPDRC